MREHLEGQSLGAYGMVKLVVTARSMACWMGNLGAELRIWEVCSRVLRGLVLGGELSSGCCWYPGAESCVWVGKMPP